MPEEKVDLQLDLIGKVCPYPTVKTNGTLNKMELVKGGLYEAYQKRE